MDITPPSKEGERGLSIDIQAITHNICNLWKALYLLNYAANTHRDERGTGPKNAGLVPIPDRTETATDRKKRVGNSEYSIYLMAASNLHDVLSKHTR